MNLESLTRNLIKEIWKIKGGISTGPTALIKTSRTSSHPLKDKTSNNASIASPILSKLNRRGFALVVKMRGKDIESHHIIKRKYLPNSRYQHRWIGFIETGLKFHFCYKDTTHKYTDTVSAFNNCWIVTPC